MNVEDREASFKRLRKRRLGGRKETDMGQRPEIIESWRALCWRVSLLEWKRWLVNQRCISFLCDRRFKVTSSKRVCSITWRCWCLWYWSKKGRHDLDEKPNTSANPLPQLHLWWLRLVGVSDGKGVGRDRNVVWFLDRLCKDRQKLTCGEQRSRDALESPNNAKGLEKRQK